MGEPLDRRERRELCDLLLQFGPDAPTLCEGWTASDLAAHLVIRERSLRGAPGIALGEKVALFARSNAAAMAREQAKGFDEVVRRVRSGPPLLLRPLSPLINVNEYAIHHEDLRRANGLGARSDRDDLQDALWRLYRRVARLIPGRPKRVGVVLERPDGDTIVIGKPPSARLRGAPLEIGLYLFGRKGAADVELTGDPAAIRAYVAADLRL